MIACSLDCSLSHFLAIFELHNLLLLGFRPSSLRDYLGSFVAEAGAEGSPWGKQDQFVLGAAYMITPSIKVFTEAVRAKGWVPLNFLSGGNPGPDGFAINNESWSDQGATTDAIVFGLTAAF